VKQNLDFIIKKFLESTQVPKVDFKIDYSMQTAFYVIDMILYIYEPLNMLEIRIF